MGDFIEILYAHEIGGAPRSQSQMENFSIAIEEFGLRDLSYHGHKYIWKSNSWDARRYMKERLDWALRSRSWCARFSSYRVINDDH